MWPLIRDSLHDLLLNKEFARARMRSVIGIVGTALGALTASGQFQEYLSSKWGPFVATGALALAVGIGQGEKNKPQPPAGA